MWQTEMILRNGGETKSSEPTNFRAIYRRVLKSNASTASYAERIEPSPGSIRPARLPGPLKSLFKTLDTKKHPA